MKKAFTLVLFMSLLISVSSNGPAAEKDSFAGKYEALSRSLDEKLAAVKSRDEYQKFMTEQKSALETLLGQHASDPASDPVELLRARILIDLKNYPEAGKKLDGLLAAKSPLRPEAQLFRAKILIETEKIAQAVPLFRQVEGKLPRSIDFFEVYMALAINAPDDMLKREYSLKILAAPDLPRKFAEYLAEVSMNLANLEMKQRQIDKARMYLEDGLKVVTDPNGIKWLKASLKQLEFIGMPAPAISAEKWLNSAPLELDKLKGKVVVIDFWAPWCPPCRKVIPTLAKDYNELKDKGLVVIGFTKLYGSYRDDIQNKGPVEAEEEKKLIQGFVERWQLAYPIAISDKGEDFSDYGVSGIPTMVFIDKAGRVYEVKVGSGDEAAITAKIRKLLAEK
jgi:thiol-disulfide isomerase/thioredoxin